MTNATRKWIRSGLELLLHGVAAAVASTISAAFIDSKDWWFFTPNFWKMAGATFGANGGLQFFKWWATHPLPDDTDPPFPGNQIPLNPLTQVISTPVKQPPPPTPDKDGKPK
jgi:hypothetical protein